MKQLLFVDDDAVLTRAYRDRLSAHGFRVNTARNAASALSILRSAQPDLVVLDLMLPDLSGVELLRFIRAEPKFAPTPVVVLTDSYGNHFGRQAANLGIQKAFRKSECSPSVLMAAIDEILHPALAAARPPVPEAEPVTLPAEPALNAPPEDAAPVEPAATNPPEDAAPAGIEEPAASAEASLLADAPALCAELSQLLEALAHELKTGPEQQDLLQDLFCQVHFLAAAAGQTEFPLLVQTTARFEDLARVLMEKPERLGPSVLQTLRSMVEVVQWLFQHTGESSLGAPLGTHVLVVDDDPLSNQMVLAALQPAQLNVCSAEDSLEAWERLNHEHFDLVLLDIEMPVLDGWELCERLRMAPGYGKTPVLFVTAHDDEDTRARSTQSGADDLLTKPILPQELAARVVMHLVRTRISV
jgi:DNA-binding response OmpR family regulator/HPt (histidine-containing phosphotransfer) domain-containing protein